MSLKNTDKYNHAYYDKKWTRDKTTDTEQLVHVCLSISADADIDQKRLMLKEQIKRLIKRAVFIEVCYTNTRGP